MNDKLQLMFEMQEAFMRRLKERDPYFPGWPLDMSTKYSQKEIRDLLWKAQHELAEGVVELKNAKEHRVTDVQGFDDEKLLEEIVDAFKFMQEAMIFMGITADDFYAAYTKKNDVINARIDNSY